MAFGDLTQKWHGQYYRIPPQITYVFARTVAHVCSKFDKAHQTYGVFFCCHWTDPSETSSRRLTQMKRRCQFSSRFDILGGRWSLVIMVMGAESVGSRPWSQMTWRQNLVQIGRKLRVSRTKPFLQAWQEEAWPLVIGPSSLLKKKIKVVGFVSKSVGSRLWCKVTCMPNLVQIDREIKKFIRLCNRGRQCLRQGGPLGGQWGAPPHHHPLGWWAIAHGPKCNA